MPLSPHGRELLLKITGSKAGQIDVSTIPENELDDAVDEVGGVLLFHKTLRLNKVIAKTLARDELAAANILLEQVKEGVLTGKATLARGPMGHVVMHHGIDSGMLPLQAPKSAYQVRIKSLKSWGITYGYRIWMNHAVVQDIAKGGTIAAQVLAWLPVAGWISTAIGLAATVLKAFDRGNGVYFYITFAGIWWVKSA